MCCLQTDMGQGLKTLFERQAWLLIQNNAKLFPKKASLPLNCASSKAQSAQKNSANMRTKGCNLSSKTDEESRKLPMTERFGTTISPTVVDLYHQLVGDLFCGSNASEKLAEYCYITDTALGIVSTIAMQPVDTKIEK